MDIDFSLDASEAKRLFTQIAERTAHFGDVFMLAREYLRAAWSANFAGNGFMVGGWAPLAPETAAWKAKHGYPLNPLIGNGNLMRSLLSMAGPANDIGSHSASFGTTVDYAHFHQTGTRHMPKREIVFDPPGFANVLAEATAHHLMPGGLAEFKGSFR